MNKNENLPIEADIISIRATAEEAKKLRADLQKKTTIIRKNVETQQRVWGMKNEFRLPQGPARIGGQWFV